MWGDRLTPAEAERMKVVLSELGPLMWASPLVGRIEQRGGISVATQPELFEARVAHELHRMGNAPYYEYGAGVGETSVDFRIAGQPEFLIEVVSLRTSEGAQAAVHSRGPLTEFRLSTENLGVEGRERETIEKEVLLVQQKLGEKVLADGQVVKFPPAEPGRVHVLIMDVRGLFGGGEDMRSLKPELRVATYGYSGVDELGGRHIRLGMHVPASDGTMQPLRGIFEDVPGHPLRAATLLRERIHAVHFVYETSYEEGEILTGNANYIILNSNLLRTKEDDAAFREGYVLMPKA